MDIGVGEAPGHFCDVEIVGEDHHIEVFGVVADLVESGADQLTGVGSGQGGFPISSDEKTSCELHLNNEVYKISFLLNK